MEVVPEGLQLVNSCEWVERVCLKSENCNPGVNGCGSQYAQRTEEAGRGCRVSVLCVPEWSVQLGAIFCIDPVFLVDEIVHEQTQNLVMLKLFPDIPVTMEQIYVFKTSTTGYTHTQKINGAF